MSKKTVCDGCGNDIKTPALTFDVGSKEPAYDDYLRYAGTDVQIRWNPPITEGHLCPSCATYTLRSLNTTLTLANTDE